MENARQHLAESIAAEQAAREEQRATRAALDMARTRCQECRDAIPKLEETLAKARVSDPDELIAAAREGRPPVLSKANEQRNALAAARDELDAAERTEADLRSRIPQAESKLGYAKSATSQAASRVIQDSTEWTSLIEKMRRHEKELSTCYAVLHSLADAGVYHAVSRKFDPAGNGDHGAERRMRQSADQEILKSWAKAFASLSNDAQTFLPQIDALPFETKSAQPKRSRFAAK